jgi:hypothetical protein
MLRKNAVLTVSVLLFNLSSACFAEPQTTENPKGFTIIVSHLDDEDSSNDMCLKDTLSGRVVARKFNDIGIELKGFTVEYSDGTRDYIYMCLSLRI